ncbi:MAG: hypothetical protein KF905_12565 [Flavobacteriales bacterium]|nr:hypothetical protein [Flavobacteriales bacterium]
MRPPQILLFLLAVLLVLALVGALIPSEGLNVAGLTIRFPSAQEVLFAEKQQKVDISDILAMPTDENEAAELALLTTVDDLINGVDTAGMDTLPANFEDVRFDPSRIPPLEERIVLHYPTTGKSALHPFFEALTKAAQGKRPMRIMHYGDSQLEGDRITNYVRNKLQSQFGGQGPGLVSVADIVPNFSVERILSPNWQRFSIMGRRDSSLTHDRFGALGSFSRFTPILPDSLAPDTVVHTATITLKPHKRSYARARDWTVCRLYFGWHRAPVVIEVARNGELVNTETIQPGARMRMREWRFAGPSEEVTITLRGTDSPDVFGVSLEGASGVAMDNIAARGGAGYEFRKMDQQLLQSMYDDLGVKLLILQYGGNVLPNIKSVEEAWQYGRFFGGQIARFKKMIPGLSVIVIGPSDMSIKDGEQYVTRPFLEDVRDAMKQHSLEQGAAFWDMYTAMGGRGSMVSWVEADPPLAATDYTHFSPAGSKKIGELFYTALINDYAEWLSSAPSAAKARPASPEKKDQASKAEKAPLPTKAP